MIPWARRVSTALLGTRSVNHAVRTLARARGHRLVLVYHRLGAALPPGCELIPSVPADVLRAQLQVLGEVVDLVTLEEILVPGDGRPGPPSAARRAAVAVTFDDDLASHTAHALPVLRELAIPAAFFLSGRALHGLGPYWFQQLEAVLVSHGPLRTADLLGLPPLQSAAAWLRHCQSDAALRERVGVLSADLPDPGILPSDGVTALGAAGMTIGFHTLDHDILPEMNDAALRGAVSRGRDELARAAGTVVRYFAYPYGRSDARSAAAVAHAGFEAAFTGRPEPVRPRSHGYRLGRWEPGPLGVDALLVKLAVRLHRKAPAGGEESL